MYLEAGLGLFQIFTAANHADVIRSQARTQARINELNAQYAELDAYKAEQDGISREARYQTLIDQVVSEQKVAFAAQDIDINFGTAKELREESQLAGYLNQVDIRNQAHQQALGYKTQARNIRLGSQSASSQAEFNASSTFTSGLLRGIGTGLSGYPFGGGDKKTPTETPSNSYFNRNRREEF